MYFNLCTCFACNYPELDYTEANADQFIRESLFEGDDGLFGMHEVSILDMESFATKAGFLLKFDVGNWDELSFCGNHYVHVDGDLVKYRDPIKTAASLCVVFSPDKDTYKNVPQLQRAKAISCLLGPWVPGASVFACCIERLTRDIRINNRYLENTGRLRKYSEYKIEGCLPPLCRIDSDKDWAEEVSACDKAAGGIRSRSDVLKMFHSLRDTHMASYETDHVVGSYSQEFEDSWVRPITASHIRVHTGVGYDVYRSQNYDPWSGVRNMARCSRNLGIGLILGGLTCTVLLLSVLAVPGYSHSDSLRRVGVLLLGVSLVCYAGGFVCIALLGVSLLILRIHSQDPK